MNDPITRLVEKIIDGNYDLKEKKVLLNEVRKIMSPEQSRWNFRYAIWTLALIALSIPIIILLRCGTAPEDAVPDGLLSLGSAAVGALAAFLTPYTQRTQGGSATTDSGTDTPSGTDLSGAPVNPPGGSGLPGGGVVNSAVPGVPLTGSAGQAA